MQLILLILACKGGDDTSGGNLDDDWDRYVTALEATCDRIDECGPIGDFSTAQECHDAIEEEYRGHPCNTFQPDVAQRCTDAIPTASCDDLQNGTIPECEEDECPDTAPARSAHPVIVR